MSILSGPRIEELATAVPATNADGSVVTPVLRITPFTPELVGPNSVDVRLGPTLLMYQSDRGRTDVLDTRAPNPAFRMRIPETGYVLRPGVLYLGATVESVECHGLVPWIDGRSSVGRLGLAVHKTAGRGDDGWSGPLTLELSVVHPLRVYPYDVVAQITFFTLEGARRPYTGRYRNSTGPVASRMHVRVK